MDFNSPDMEYYSRSCCWRRHLVARARLRCKMYLHGSAQLWQPERDISCWREGSSMHAVQPLQLADLPSGNLYSSYNVQIFYRRYFDILCILKCGQFRICELILPLLSILIFPFSLFIYNAGCAKYTIFSVLYNIKHKSYLQPL